MARGRMFDRAFMKSRKVQALTRDHRLVYACILPFLDRDGRIIAEPLYLKAHVFRHSDFTLEEIAAAIRAIADVDLVDLYADEDNDAIIQYTRFADFNTPNVKEAKSELPGPSGEGAVQCRDPLITKARAMHVQSTGIASGEVERKLNVNVNVNDQRQPPLPPQFEPTEPPDEDEAADVIRIEAARLGRAHHHKVLQASHPDVWQRLGELTSTYGWKQPQFRKVAEKLLELTREHTAGKVVAGLDKILMNAAQISWPMGFLQKVLEQDAASQTTGVSSPLTSDEELDRLFGVN